MEGEKALQEMDKGQRVLVIIPAYNEAESICNVVEELQRVCPEQDYLVVTDGSRDGTPELCRQKGYHLLKLSVNLGLGYRYAVQIDGDGQHRPEYSAPMREKMQEGYDIVMGSRFLPREDGTPQEAGEKMSGMRSLGSFLIRRAIRLTTGVRVTDPTCGLRMYNRRMMDDFAHKLNYAPEPDTISFLIKNGAKVAEVPVRIAEREGGQSYLKPMKAAAYMLKMLTSILLVQNFRA